jgi:hypothetical protein
MKTPGPEAVAKLEEWARGKAYINLPALRELMAHLIYP